MKYNNVEFDTYFKNYPDQNGFFGKYGGSYIPPELQVAMNEIAEAYQIFFYCIPFYDKSQMLFTGKGNSAQTTYGNGRKFVDNGECENL